MNEDKISIIQTQAFTISKTTITCALIPHYKGHGDSAQPVLTLIFAGILTGFEPYSYPYFYHPQLIRKIDTLVATN